MVANSGNWTNANTWTGELFLAIWPKCLFPGKNPYGGWSDRYTHQDHPGTGKALVLHLPKYVPDVQDMSGELEIGTAANPIPQG